MHCWFDWKPEGPSWRKPHCNQDPVLSALSHPHMLTLPQSFSAGHVTAKLNCLGVHKLSTTFHWFPPAAVLLLRKGGLFRPNMVSGGGMLNDPLNVTWEKNGYSSNLAWSSLWQQGKKLIECGGFWQQETWWPFPVFWRADSIALWKCKYQMVLYKTGPLRRPLAWGIRAQAACSKGIVSNIGVKALRNM